MSGELEALQPECYKRHAEIDNHLATGKFWRGVIVAAFISFIGITVAQFNVANENNRRMIEANAKLTMMVEVNSRRITSLEDIHPRLGDNTSIKQGAPNGR